MMTDVAKRADIHKRVPQLSAVPQSQHGGENDEITMQSWVFGHSLTLSRSIAELTQCKRGCVRQTPALTHTAVPDKPAVENPSAPPQETRT
jgi:hypothetical protein